MRATKEPGNGVNPKSLAPMGRKGKISAAPTISSVAMNRDFPGLLLKKGPLVRTTSTTRDAEMTDSTNQPVLNYSGESWRINNNTPKVR